MAQKTIREAINQAFDQEMGRNPTVILMGEDIVGGTGSPGEQEAWGGAFGLYKGLYKKYGDRLLDTPLSEAAFAGAAIGAATCGIYDIAGDVPEELYAIPFGEANLVREGDDCTIVSYGMMVHRAAEAAEQLAGDGIECEVVDLRMRSPIDTDTVLESVENTGRLVVVDEAHPRCSIDADVAAAVAHEGFKDLTAPVGMVTAPHTPVPFSSELEKHFVPSAEKIAACVRDTIDD